MSDIFGTAGDDTLNGTSGDDLIDGLEGNDTINGGNGADQIYGGLGLDRVHGDGGSDVLHIGSPNDVVAGELYDGGSGTDTLVIDHATGWPDGWQIDLTGVTLNRLERFEALYFPVVVNRAQLTGFTYLEGTFRLADGGSIAFAGKESSGILELSNSFTTADMRGAVTSSFLRVYAGTGGSEIQGSDFEEILFGSTGNDVLRGNGGNDDLRSGGGLDQLYGGDGDDVFYFYGNESTAGGTVDGGAGNDTLAFQLTTADVALSSVSYTGIEVLSAAPSFDNQAALLVTAAQLNAFSRIEGARFRIIDSGAVTLSGVTLMNGGSGNPYLELGSGVTSIDLTGIGAASQYHVVQGNGGANVMIGSPVDDGLLGGGGNDTIYGAGGNDGLLGEGGNDFLSGGDGSDFLDGGAGIDQLYGNSGDDELTLGALSAEAGEVYDGGDGFDVLSLNWSGSGTGGIDISAATVTGIEAIDGGTSQFSYLNVAQFNAAQILTGRLALTDAGSVSLAGKSVSSSATIAGILQVGLSDFGNSIDLAGIVNPLAVNVFGGAGSDTILGGAKGSELRGGGGNDTIVSRVTQGLDNILAGDGDDTIDGRLGRGGMHGEAGNDTLMVATNSSGSAVTGGDGHDRLIVEGSFQSGPVFAGIEAIELAGGANLTLNGSQFANGLAFNTALSGAGKITVNMHVGVQAVGSAFTIAGGSTIAVVINGTFGDDYVKAVGLASNTLVGGGGQDFLRGGQLADVIDGGADRDKITGFGGGDTLTGGGGNDQFRYILTADSTTGAGADHIVDFLGGTDQLDFRNFDADSATNGIQHPTFNLIGGAAFSGTGGAEIRYGVSGAHLLVEVDVDGDGAADMNIWLDYAGGQTLTSADFML